MTRKQLLDALCDFTRDIMADVILPVKQQKAEDEDVGPRPPLVYAQRLPDMNSATKKAPYILHQLVAGEDEQLPGQRTKSRAQMRSVLCVYGEDDQEGALRLLTVVEHFRQELLLQRAIGKQFRLAIGEKMTTQYYDSDGTAPYFLAEIITVWDVPETEMECVFR